MSRKPAFFWWVVALATGLILCYAAAGVEFWRHAHQSKDYGWYRAKHDGAWYVTRVWPNGPAQGILHVGDRILTFEGQHGPDWYVNRLVLLAPAGGVTHLAVEREGRRLDLAVPVLPLPIPVDWGIPMMSGASLVCFAVALLLGFMKPADRTVQFASFSFLALAAIQLAKALALVYSSLDAWGMATYAVLAFADPLPFASGYLFASRFPKNLRAVSGWKVVGIVLCVLVAIEWVLLVPDRFVSALNIQWTILSIRWVEGPIRILSAIPHTLWKATQVAMSAAIGAVLIRNYRALRQPDLRRRIRWLVFGIVAALTPVVILYAGAAAYSVTGFGFQINTLWFVRAEYFSTAFLGVVCSITIAYGVLRHRVLDIHLAIRRSIQYLLAKQVLQAAIFLPVLLLVWRAVLNPQLTIRGLLFGSYFQHAVAAAAALGLLYRRRLLLAIDRRFFREDYDQERILRTLIDEIKASDSITGISRLVSEKIEAALHPRRILVFYRHEARGDFTLGHTSGGVEPELRLGAGCPILRILEEAGGPRDFPLSDPGAVPAADSEYLEELGVRLLAPVTGTDHRLLGVLMLGEKRSESPYIGDDRNLLQAIAAQIGVVYENIALRESARREAQIKCNVLARLDGAEINLLKECPRCGACFDRAMTVCPADRSTLTLTLPVDRTIDGVYRLDRRVGAGAMGAVYRATDLRLGRPVAVKLMLGSLFGSHAALRRFEREARAVARLSHPNIVAVHDFGAVGNDGAYLVMELIEGVTLRTELRAAGPLDPAIAAGRFDQLLGGLSAAHAEGVVHRDLKPENLIVARLTGGGELVKILDFGLAKVTRREASDLAATGEIPLTIAGATVGTMGYMSPEQLLGEEVDERTDTFAVGVLVMECLTGRRPFAGLSFQELLAATLHEAAQIPGDEPAIRRLNAALARCLAKNRADRPYIAAIRHELVGSIRACPSLPGVRSVSMEESTIDGTRPFV
jgi:hypothetical protein